jgi:hypothetical protein
MAMAALVAAGCAQALVKATQSRNGMLFASDMEIPQDLLVVASEADAEDINTEHVRVLELA